MRVSENYYRQQGLIKVTFMVGNLLCSKFIRPENKILYPDALEFDSSGPKDNVIQLKQRKDLE